MILTLHLVILAIYLVVSIGVVECLTVIDNPYPDSNQQKPTSYVFRLFLWPIRLFVIGMIVIIFKIKDEIQNRK